MKFLKISVTYFVTLFFFQELQSHVTQGNDQFSLQRNSKNKDTTTGLNKEQDQIRLRLKLNNVAKDRLKPKTIVKPQVLAVKHRIGKTPSNNRNDRGKSKSKPQIAVDLQLPMVIQNTKMPTNNAKQTKGFDIIDAPAKEYYIEDANILSKTNVESQTKKPTYSKSDPQEIQPKSLLKEKKYVKQPKANNADCVPKNSTNIKELDLKSNEKSDNCLLLPDEIDNKLPITKFTKSVTPHQDNKINMVTEKLPINKTDNVIPIIKLSTENKLVNETKIASVLSSDKSPKQKSLTTLCKQNKTAIDEDKQTPYSIQPNSSFTTTKVDRVDNGTMDLVCIKQHNYTEVIERHSGNPSNKLQTSDHKMYYNTANANYYPFQHYKEFIRNVTHEDPFTPDFTYIQPSYEFPNVDKINAKKWEIKTTATHEKSKSTADDDNPVTTTKSWYNSEVTIKTSSENTPGIVEIEPHNINAAIKDVTHYKPTYCAEEFINHYKPTSYKEDVTNYNKPTAYKEDISNHYEPTSYKDIADHYKPTSHREDVTNNYEPTSYKDVTDHYKPTSHREDVTHHYKPNRNDKVDPVNYDTHYASNNNHNAFYGSSGTHVINKNNRYANIPEPPSCSYYPCFLYPTYNYSPYGKYI